MATAQETMTYLVDQIDRAGIITTRKMFGEYALYCDGKTVAFVCDDMLYIKPTKAGESLAAGRFEPAPPYPGAKMYMLIAGDDWEDSDWLTALIKTTAAALPPPKPKKKVAARKK